MTESPTPPEHRRSGNLQTRALAGVVAIMLAAAIVALVFVTNGSGSNNTNDDRAGGSPSDVGRTSSAATSPASPRSSSATTRSAPTSTGTKSTAPPSTAKTNTPRTSTPAGTAAKAGGSATSSKPATSGSSSHATATKKVVYTVKKGDTLTDIGRWYSDHGYLTLYNWNKSVIGENPDLIFPGQKIIVVDGNVGVARH